MKDPLNLSGIEEPDPSWWDEIHVGLVPIGIAALFLVCVGAFVIRLF